MDSENVRRLVVLILQDARQRAEFAHVCVSENRSGRESRSSLGQHLERRSVDRMSPDDFRERLYWLLEEFQKGNMGTEVFCGAFSKTYNLEVEKDQLSEGEKVTFRKLFRKVIFYSPFPEERARIANYLGDDEIRAAVEDAVVALRHGTKPAD
jgi:hypothetical protein